MSIGEGLAWLLAIECDRGSLSYFSDLKSILYKKLML